MPARHIGNLLRLRIRARQFLDFQVSKAAFRAFRLQGQVTLARVALAQPRHDVAIPVGQLQEKDGKYILPGATKEAIKALPKFEYAKK